MKKSMKQMLAIMLSISALSAVTVRQDYFPLAEGNSWSYTKQSTPNEQFKTQMYFEVKEQNDTAFIISSIYLHPLADAVELYDTVKTNDNGIVKGFKSAENEGNGMIRHLYYPGDTFNDYPDGGKPEKLIAIDSFQCDNGDTVYSDVWAANKLMPTIEFMGSTEVMAQGLGRIGFQMDLTTEEYPEKGNYGFSLDSATIKPQPSVVKTNSAMLTTYADSALSIQSNGEKGIKLNFTLTEDVGEKGYVSSSYNEITNTLRIWMADTMRHWSIDCGFAEDCLPGSIARPGGYFNHTMNIENVDFTHELNVKIFYDFYNEREFYPGAVPLSIPVYSETLRFSTAVEPQKGVVPSGSANLTMIREELQIDLTSLGAEATLLIEDLKGRVVMKKSVRHGDKINFNGNLSRGIYLARLKSPAGVANQKIRIK